MSRPTSNRRRRTLLSLLATAALSVGSLVLPSSPACASPREPPRIAPCYGVRYTPPPQAPSPKKPAPSKPRGR